MAESSDTDGRRAWARLRLNCRQFAPGVWRAAQPRPRDLAAFAAAGGRTVISLRAGRRIGPEPAEIAACRALGLAFLRVPIRAHRLPTAEEIGTAVAAFRGAARPVLIHCGSGADRAGFAAALWLALVEGRRPAEARRELTPRHGHNPLGRAGLLDAFFDAYERAARRAPLPLEEWITRNYDPEAISAEWRREGMHRRLIRVLARPALG